MTNDADRVLTMAMEKMAKSYTPKLPWPDDRTLEGTLHPLIWKGEVPKAAPLKEKVEPFLKSLLKWDERHSAFLDAVMNGKADGEILFPDDPMLAGKTNRHPALLWKIQNLLRAR